MAVHLTDRRRGFAVSKGSDFQFMILSHPSNNFGMGGGR